MKRKGVAKLKRSSSKHKKKNPIVRRKNAIQATRPQPQQHLAQLDDPAIAAAVENYEAGLKLMQEHKFERARVLLDKVVKGPSRELADRAAVHLSTCSQHLARAGTSFKTPEEHYDYAISLMNAGSYQEARTHLEKIIKQHSKADYAVYGLSVLDCLTGRVEDSLRNLDRAIRMNTRNRLQARNDPDFQNLFDDPRFTELLYPEEGVQIPALVPAEGKRR